MAIHDTAGFGSETIDDRPIDIRVLELLTARLCHELSGPVAAISNGVELLSEEGADFIGDALTLVSDSARRAANRLQFYRFAYGYSDSAASTGPAPHELARDFFAASRIVCDYPAEVRMLPLDWQQLACNLLSVGAETLPRGGRLALTTRPLTVEAVGETVILSPQMRAALTLSTSSVELTPRTVQPYFTGLLARALDCGLSATAAPEKARLSVVTAGI
jgi:histidine phosphotransferase ChpT